MENLFRIMLVRPAVARNNDVPPINLQQESEFQSKILAVQQSETLKKQIQEIARQFVTQSTFINDPKKLVLYKELNDLDNEVRELESKSDITHANVIKAIEKIFQTDVASLLQNNTLDKHISSLKDSIIAIKLLPEEHEKPIEELSNQLRNLEMVKLVSTGTYSLNEKFLHTYRRRPLEMPTKADSTSLLFNKNWRNKIEKGVKEAQEKELKLVNESKIREYGQKLEISKKMEKAINELTNIRGEHLEVTSEEEDEGITIPEGFSMVDIIKKNMNNYNQSIDFNMKREELILNKLAEGSTELPEIKVNDLYMQPPPLNKLLLSGSPKFKPSTFKSNNLVTKPTIRTVLSDSTNEILTNRKLDPTILGLEPIVGELKDEIMKINTDLDSQIDQPVHTIKRVGNTLINISTIIDSDQIKFSPDLTLPPGVVPGLLQSVPTSHGSVNSAGIADLLVIKQQLVRYEGTDLAHIENILKGEKKEREHTQRREIQDTTFSESEVTISEERELESTSRFEMGKETQETIKADASFKTGLSVSGKYGPIVEVAASIEGSASLTKETAANTASKYSQDLTERTANKLTERILNRRNLQITNEVIEKNNHLLDNTEGTEHVSGSYQWVNKVYQAQMYNYGIRSMYDFMIPEPGSFLMESQINETANIKSLQKPRNFPLKADDIKESNYFKWMKRYNATDVTPPPEMYKTKSFQFHSGGRGEEEPDFQFSGQVTIDEDYMAIKGVVGKFVNYLKNTFRVGVLLGSKAHVFNGHNSAFWHVALDKETESIPFALLTRYVSDLAITGEIICQRTDRAFKNWQIDTFSKLTLAYKARVQEYEEELASLEIQAGIAVSGKNPEFNLELIKDELKKNCISILTEQHFDLFNSIEMGSLGPQINLRENEAEGPYVRFFEQAFEWEHMSWITYPYFWGRKNQWNMRINYEDTDPTFAQFLKAGYCRVEVPARPGFEGAIDHFMTHGDIWQGGPLPTIGNPLYIHIAEEIAERLNRSEDEFPEGEPWPVRVPTTLVRLRTDNKLPKWKEQDGEWIEE